MNLVQVLLSELDSVVGVLCYVRLECISKFALCHCLADSVNCRLRKNNVETFQPNQHTSIF